MRKALPAILFLFAFISNAHAQQPFGTPRRALPVTNWTFWRSDLTAEAVSAASPPPQGQTVTVPHTWNNMDGQDGGGNYFRGDGWYRCNINVPPTMAGKSLYLRFQGANRRADVFVNRTKVGEHIGGTQAFAVDITKAAKPGDNIVAVRVNNARDDTAPLQADFTFFGGLYRPVELVIVEPFHISLTDYGSPGVYITTPEVTAALAKVLVRVHVRNTAATALAGSVNIGILGGNGEGLGIPTVSKPVTVPPDATQEVAVEVTVPNPHLWNGVADPHLYRVQAFLIETGNPRPYVDVVVQPLGIRTFSVDPARGFLLNGKPYDLHGVNRHQDRKDMGWALTNKEHDEDMALIKELGCTSIRLAHYQHSEYFYQLCDKEGMVVWAEIPVVDRLGNTNSTFTENAKQQYIELIRQNFNHPSIAFWSAGNEVDEDGGNFNRAGPANVYDWFKEMSALGHKEDPSRLTASAWREKYFPPAGTTDVIGLNEYLGWYTGGGPGNNSGWENLEAYIIDHSNIERTGRMGLKGMWAMTEYGAGSSIYFHSEKPVRMDHTEEYQALLHEKTWEVFARHPEIWGKYVWNMFDFAVDGRAEGDRGGINDKGLVTHDRKVKKDAFYFYKAVWTDPAKDPFVHITSKRFTTRGLEKIPIKIYTNLPSATLYVNGINLGAGLAVDGVMTWEAVTLKPGANQVQASTTRNGKQLTDQCTWTHTPGAPTEVYEAQDDRMRNALRAGPPRAR